MPPGSFAFRIQCYERFGWKPEDIPNIPEAEAYLLAVYFEEMGAYQYRENKKLEAEQRRAAGNTSGNRTERVEEVFDDDEEDEDEWLQQT